MPQASDDRALLDESRIAYIYLNVEDPFVAWQVYRAAVVSSAIVHESALSLWMTGYLRELSQGPERKGRFEAEWAIEQIRQRENPGAVSRLRGFFAFPDELSAQRAAERRLSRRFDRRFLAEVRIADDARLSRHDSEWITHNLDAPDVSWIRNYLAGTPHGKHPIWELLVEGKALVCGTALREQAYETVRRTWPDSMTLLEIARLGGELGSDLGLIAPMLSDTGDGLEVVYCINMVDAEDDEFLKRVERHREEGGPINWDDLDIGSDTFTAPDLRRGFFRL